MINTLRAMQQIVSVHSYTSCLIQIEIFLDKSINDPSLKMLSKRLFQFDLKQ